MCLPDHNIHNDVDCNQPQSVVDNQLDGSASTGTVATAFDSNNDVGISVDELHDLVHIPHEAPVTAAAAAVFVMYP